MGWYYIVLVLHILGATIWVGGHIVVALRLLPEALKKNDASIILDFEKKYELIGMPSLLLQVLTGLWLAWHILGPLDKWLENSGLAHSIQAKLLLLLFTVILAIHAKTRVIPNINNSSLKSLAWHIRGVTFCAVLFVLVGASIRFGGF